MTDDATRRTRTRIEGEDLDGRVVHLRQGGNRELAIRQDAASKRAASARPSDWPQDEETGGIHNRELSGRLCRARDIYLAALSQLFRAIDHDTSSGANPYDGRWSAWVTLTVTGRTSLSVILDYIDECPLRTR